jgi:hypothetical protein
MKIQNFSALKTYSSQNTESLNMPEHPQYSINKEDILNTEFVYSCKWRSNSVYSLKSGTDTIAVILLCINTGILESQVNGIREEHYVHQEIMRMFSDMIDAKAFINCLMRWYGEGWIYTYEDCHLATTNLKLDFLRATLSPLP